MKAFSFTVFGMVQGVGFRYYTQKKAEALSISGWVKNEEDGTVKGVAAGEENKLQLFMGWLHSGPASGRVDKLIYQEIDNAHFSGFEIIR